MISQINITVNAAKPKFPLAPMVAFNGSPSSVRISGVPCSIGNWSINSVRVLVSYPNNFTVEKTAVKVDNFWIATIDGSQVNGVIKNGFQVIADGVDENNLPVTGYVLGVGDVVVVPRDKGIERLVDRYAVRYLNEPPVNPSIGDMLNLNGQFRVWDGSKWVSINGEDVVVYDSAITLQANGVEIDSFTVNASEAKTIDIPVPSKTSELDNDSGFITSAAIPSKVSELDNDVGYVTSEAIPSKVSELDNDAGYITMSAIPAIPSATSDLENDSGFITASAIPSQISSFENDVGYITASQVQPASNTHYAGWATGAAQTVMLEAVNFAGHPYNQIYVGIPYDGVFRRYETVYAPWLLAEYNGTTFDPPTEMTFGYTDTFMVKIGVRTRTVYVGAYCWRSGRYIIKAELDGAYYKPTQFGWVNNSGVLEWYETTFNSGKTSIETVGGQSGIITCTREYTYVKTTKEVAYTDQIPSSVSQLTNDVGYITASAIPSNISSFNNDVGYLTASSSAFTAKRDKTDLVYKVGFDKDSLDKVVKFVVEYVDGNNQNVTATLDKYDEFTQTWTGDNTNWRVYTYLAGMGAELYFALDDGTAGQDAQPAPSQGAEDTSWNFTYNSNPATWTMVMTQNIALQQDFKNLRDMKDISYPASVDSTGMYTIQKFNVNGTEVAHFTTSGSTSTWDTNDPVVNQYEISTTDGTNFTMVSNRIQIGTFTMTNLKNDVVDVTYDGNTYTVGATFKQTTFALKDYVDAQIGSINTILDNINGEII